MQVSAPFAAISPRGARRVAGACRHLSRGPLYSQVTGPFSGEPLIPALVAGPHCGARMHQGQEHLGTQLIPALAAGPHY